MKHHQLSVEHNMRNMLQDCPTKPGIPPEAVRVLRAELLLEECLETIAALGISVHMELKPGILTGERLGVTISKESEFTYHACGPVDLTQIADGLADMEYVELGTAIACGLWLEPFFQEVHRSNMTKCWTDAEIATLQNFDGQIHAAPNPVEDRKWVVLTRSGKYLKSPSYERAELHHIVLQQMEGK